MKVAVYYNNRNIDIEERPIPEPGEGEILVQTKACGVCVGDTMEWYLTPRAPMVMGHEATGIVARTGKGVKNVREGDRVFVHHHVPCLICDSCLKGRYTSCATFRATHYNPGGFAEYFLASAHHVAVDTLILPEQVGFVEGTLIEPLACVIHALRLAAIKSEESVVLVGTGAMGLMFIQVLLHYGIRKLVVYELLPWRQEIARRFGAPVVLSPLEEPGAEAERLQSILSAEGADKAYWWWLKISAPSIWGCSLPAGAAPYCFLPLLTRKRRSIFIHPGSFSMNKPYYPAIQPITLIPGRRWTCSRKE